MNETSVSRGDGSMSRATETQLYGLMSAIFAIGGGLGAVSTQKLAAWTGRYGLIWQTYVYACVLG